MDRRAFLRGLLGSALTPLTRLPIIGPTVVVWKARSAGTSTIAMELAMATRKALIPKLYTELYKPSPLLNALLKKEEGQ